MLFLFNEALQEKKNLLNLNEGNGYHFSNSKLHDFYPQQGFLQKASSSHASR